MSAVADPDLVKAACTVVQREWGMDGYGVDLPAGGSGGVVLEVVCLRDGSRFHLWYSASGQWGHAEDLDQALSDMALSDG